MEVNVMSSKVMKTRLCVCVCVCVVCNCDVQEVNPPECQRSLLRLQPGVYVGDLFHRLQLKEDVWTHKQNKSVFVLTQ